MVRCLKNSGNQYDYILTIARGGLVPAQFVAYALDIKAVHVITNIRGGYPRTQPNMKCLIVDDINDTSKTTGAMKDFVMNNRLAGSVDVAVMYERHNAPLKADFVGDIVADDGWLEFTWDKEL